MRKNTIDELLDDTFNSNAEIIPVLSKDDEDCLFSLSVDVPDRIPVLPIRGNVLFPAVVMPINVNSKSSLKLLKEVQNKDMAFGVVTQVDVKEKISRVDLFDCGTIGKVIQVVTTPDGTTVAIVQGFSRFLLGGFSMNETKKYYEGDVVKLLPEVTSDFKGSEARAVMASVRRKYLDSIKTKMFPKDVLPMLKSNKLSRFVVNVIASHLECPIDQKQEILEMDSYLERVKALDSLLNTVLKKQDVKQEISDKANKEINRQQREFFLRQQMQEIQRELGGGPADSDIQELTNRAKKANLPLEVETFFYKELDKLKRIQPQVADYVVQYNYLSLILDLPWDTFTTDNLDVAHAKKILDRDHYGMEKVKERILEYIAVLSLKKDMKSPILCLVGPPGTGKTSLGKSIATALGRKYVRVALGGLHDESEIRGHRKTYVGSMPGRIIENIKKAGSSNPVFILDEIDKVQSETINGDPTSALLEVLDPEQNMAFHDNYLDLDYDLSRVFFIATANSLSTIQPALLDRMEVIDLSGYIHEEKMEIASRHLVPKQLKENGFKKSDLKFPPEVISVLINDYTREAGVRQLDKAIAKVVRRRAVKVVGGEKTSKTVAVGELKSALGLPIHQSERRSNDDRVGVVTGLAWTSVGGEILFVEASTSKGKGTLSMTGNLGDVMKESATLAHEYLKANGAVLGIEEEKLENCNIHVHVPEGATPKDGPSAGITMFTAMFSALSGRKVRSDFAMTGEITLRGKVTPIGGVKEKLLAAKRAGISDIVLCEDNRRDVDDISQVYLEGLTFHYVTEMSQVLDLVLV